MFIPKRLAWHFAKRLKVWVQLFQNRLTVDEIAALHGGYQIRIGSSVITAKHVVIAGGAASAEAYARASNDSSERPMHATRCNGHAITLYTFS